LIYLISKVYKKIKMTAALVVFTQVGVTKLNGETYTNPLTVTVDTMPNDVENLTKGLEIVPSPKVSADQVNDTTDSEYGANSSQILDLLMKVEQRITINGYLSNGSWGTDSSTTAAGKKADLKKIFLGGGAFNMTYEGSTFSVNADKLEIRRIAAELDSTQAETAEFMVTMTAIRGTDI
jgi:hypothetical protein